MRRGRGGVRLVLFTVRRRSSLLAVAATVVDVKCGRTIDIDKRKEISDKVTLNGNPSMMGSWLIPVL